MTQSQRKLATVTFCLMALVPVFAPSERPRAPLSGKRTAIKLIAGEAARAATKHADLRPSPGASRPNSSLADESRTASVSRGATASNRTDTRESRAISATSFFSRSLLDSALNWYRLSGYSDMASRPYQS
jgi:hypothetical protein